MGIVLSGIDFTEENPDVKRCWKIQHPYMQRNRGIWIVVDWLLIAMVDIPDAVTRLTNQHAHLRKLSPRAAETFAPITCRDTAAAWEAR